MNFEKKLKEYVAREVAKHDQELAEDKIGKVSRYNGVSRFNCDDGYVDVRTMRSAPTSTRLPMNGSTFDGKVDDCRAYFRLKGFDIYNYERKDDRI